MVKAGLLVVALLGACGDQEQFIVVNVYMDTPSLVAVNTNGEWTTPQLIAPQQYGFGADGDYKFVAVCENDDATFAAEEVVGRPDPEIIGWNMYPGFSGAPPGGCYGHHDDDHPTHVVVAGTVSGMAEVSTYGASTESVEGAATWDYSMIVEPGVHDVVASTLVAGNPHVVIRRAVDMQTSQVLAPIDLEREQISTIDQAIQVTGVAGEAMSTDVRLFIGQSTSADVSHSFDSTFTLLDPTALLQGDDEELSLTAGSGFTSATATTSYAGVDLGPIALPPPVSATFHESPAGLSADWGPLPEYSYMAMALDDKMSNSFVRVISQHEYAAARGEISFEAPPDFPARWTPSWTQQLVDSNRTFEVASSDASWFYTSSVMSGGDDKSDVNVRPWKSPGRRMRSSLTP